MIEKVIPVFQDSLASIKKILVLAPPKLGTRLSFCGV